MKNNRLLSFTKLSENRVRSKGFNTINQSPKLRVGKVDMDTIFTQNNEPPFEQCLLDATIFNECPYEEDLNKK